jgi:F-type H+-transporting ATPase subunit gamma
MAQVREILGRRKAVNNICRITRTMEMMSTAKYKAIHERWIETTDFFDALAQAAFLLLTAKQPVEHPLLRDNLSGKAAILAIGSDRGLCGPYNNRVNRLVEEHIRTEKDKGMKLDIYAVGSRLIHILNFHKIVPTKMYEDIKEMPNETQLDRITQDFIDLYEAGTIDYFGVIYSRFYSVTSQQAQTLTIMPLTELIDDLITMAKVVWPWDYTFEDFYLSPSADLLVENLARMIVRSSIQNCFMEALLSEHVSRMIAMRSATENANDMIRVLTGDYNRARQTQITSELLDIISGTGVAHNE